MPVANPKTYVDAVQGRAGTWAPAAFNHDSGRLFRALPYQPLEQRRRPYHIKVDAGAVPVPGTATSAALARPAPPTPSQPDRHASATARLSS